MSLWRCGRVQVRASFSEELEVFARWILWRLSSQSSHIRHISLKDRLLFCLPPLAVGPGLSLCEMTPDGSQKVADPNLLGGVRDVRPEWCVMM